MEQDDPFGAAVPPLPSKKELRKQCEESANLTGFGLLMFYITCYRTTQLVKMDNPRVWLLDQ